MNSCGQLHLAFSLWLVSLLHYAAVSNCACVCMCVVAGIAEFNLYDWFKYGCQRCFRSVCNSPCVCVGVGVCSVCVYVVCVFCVGVYVVCVCVCVYVCMYVVCVCVVIVVLLICA